MSALRDLDVCVASDLRFPGGSSSSTYEEVCANLSLGIRTALFHTPSTTLQRERPFNIRFQSLLREDPDLLLMPGERARASLLLFRHPSVVNRHDLLPDITPRHILVVINHPMRNAQGRIDFNLNRVRRVIEKRYASAPAFYAISPSLRATYAADQRSLIAEDAFWYNIFSTSGAAEDAIAARLQRLAGAERIVIGRHSRDAPEKWPEDPEILRAAYPDREDLAIHVLGGGQAPRAVLGALPGNWTIHEFDTLPVAQFLAGLDVFVYFHHSRWIEAFGRVVAEAVAAGVPAILPERFRELFEDGALYCTPAEVPSVIDRLRTETGLAERVIRAGRAVVERRFSWAAHRDRLAPFLDLSDTAVTA